MENSLRRVRSIADYQFGAGTGAKLFPENVQISYSKSTGRIRYITMNGERLATLRPTDGMLSLSVAAARFMAEKLASAAHCFVTARQDVAEYIAEGGDVFAQHVIKADEEIRAKDEVIVLDETGKVLAVGRAVLCGAEMTAFKTGVAVKVRHGSKDVS
ncbi:MAG: PUA domain-containing protein [Candidatus Bathyarchaeia archaeon]